MSSRDALWRKPYEAVRRRLRVAAAALRREPWLVVGGSAAALIVIIAIASHGKATPSAPVQSLNGQAAMEGGHTHLPGQVPVQVRPTVEAQSQAPPSTPAVSTPVQTTAPTPPEPTLPSTPPQHGQWPVSGKIVQGYGWVFEPIGGYWFYNTSLEIAAAQGTPVRAAFPGIVKDIERDPSQGLTVVVDCGGGLQATYGGLAASSLQIGQQVAAGAEIGQLAATSGASARPGLRFTLRQGSQPVDPAAYLTEPGQ